MDEIEFRAAMRRLAEPRQVTMAAVAAIQHRVAVKRRQRLIGVAVGVAVVMVTGGAVSAQMTSSTTLEPAIATHSIQMSVYSGDYGIRLGMHTRFSEDREVLAASVRAGNATASATVYPDDGVDYDAGPPVPLPLPAGTRMTAEGTVMPVCGDDATSPIVFIVESRLPGGELVVDRYSPTNPEVYGPALDKWCTRGLYVSAGGGSLTADGDAEALLTVINPGPDAIVVEVPAFSDGGATWSTASTTVPAGELVSFTVEGTGVRYDGSQEVPWERGRLLIDGEPFTFPTPDGWLG